MVNTSRVIASRIYPPSSKAFAMNHSRPLAPRYQPGVAALFWVAVIVALSWTPARADDAGVPADREAFVAACEATLAERLRAPSTYQRIRVRFLECAPATLEEYLGWDNPVLKAADEELMRSDPGAQSLHEDKVEFFKALGAVKHVAVIDYDAQNAYGVPIRGTALCRQVSTTCTWKPSPIFGPTVDGFTAFDWTMHGG